MFTPSSSESLVPRPRFGLLGRLLLAGAVLGVETLLISGLIQSPALDALTGAAKVTHDIQHWVFRFAIAYLGSFAILLYLRGSGKASSAAARGAPAPVRVQWLIVHAALLAGFAALSTLLYRGGDIPFAVLALAWHACGLAASLALFAAIAPLRFWLGALRQTGALPLYSLLPAAGALLVFKLSQWLWAPAAAVTFKIVGLMVYPLVPSLRTDVSSLTLITDHFSVQVSEICSGLEGVGLMLAFCTAWLFYFRREYIFPRALIIAPIGMLLIFLLNSVRIAALVLIGDAGYQKIAAVGFHSQAGWIAFNLAAFAVAYAAKGSTWLNAAAHEGAAHGASSHEGGPGGAAIANDATAAYLMPLLAILAAGMLAHAMSAGFDFLYPLRIVAAVGALWIYRRSYANLDWRFTWRGVSVGVAMFGMWSAFSYFLSTPMGMPDELARLSSGARAEWIACRAAAAIITVPIAEELAYRGFLMRRLVSAQFDQVAFSSVRWPAIAISSVLFGVTHGGLWFAGIIAGAAYGALVAKTGKIGESIAAHAATNLLVAGQVLLFGAWQLW
ncbi:MAG: exosortase E/protease, VPEID-CTERM system [Pseudomonadota bacterium]|nr:exosortase E/protease, VPEID-CTERM system [Pseudomonadota bacterium]